GPTETTVYAVMHLCAPDSHRSPPIGKPMPNTQCYILDEALNPVPVGVTGELHIGGPGLARGYLHRPGLTAERFIPNPFGPPNSRLYKSGDLARYLPDGAIEHRGRSDGQIKLRGQRIELGEIEAMLAAIDGVTEALVMLREDEPGERRLVAYVGGKLAPDAIALRTALHQTLPDHMVPAHFVLLEALPLNHNGKVDRRALPAPQAGDAAGYTPPATATEEILAAIWAGLLKQDRVGTHDNFFALGGHSLLVTQLVSKIRTAFGIELPVRAPFEAPTLAALARRIDAEHGHDLLPAILATPRDDTLPLSFAQQRLWFLDQYEPGAAVYNMPAALRLRGNLDATSLQNALNEIVQRHECLRTHYVQQEGMPQQVIVSRLSLALPVTDLRDLPHGEREARAEWLIEAEAQAPFDLSAGPVIRASLLRLADDEHVLLCTMHHIVSDGWSSGIFVRELAALYTAFSQGAPSPLAALTIQYADFAAWQRRWLSGEVLQRQLGFWRQRLQGAPALLALPTERPRPPVQSYRGASYDFSIPASHVAPLAALTRGEGATLFMGLAAAFNLLLSRYSGQDDICVGTPIANRKHAELENLIGFFANTLVLRTQIENGACFRTLLQQVKGNLLDAYAHQDVPFEQVVEAVAPPRSLAYSPLFQTMLILQNAPGDALQLPGLTLEQMDAEVGTSKFDFRLSLWEEQDGSLHGSFEYNTDLFERSTMARMGSHFAQLLQAAGTQPDSALDALPLLSVEEKTRLLQIWDAIQPGFTSKTDAELALPLPTHHVLDLFEAAALAVPDKTAIEWRFDRVSYRQLDADSNRLAGHLLADGMHPGAVAAIMLHNPVSQIIATIAILKAGGVFTSLNLRYPVQRVREMLELVRPDWIITDQDSAVQAAQAATGLEWPHRRVLLDGPLDGDDRYVRVAVGPDSPCHIFYTSGSTGKPKPVLGRTSGLAHFIQWEIDTASIGQDVRASQLTNPSFHVYLRDIFPALCCGGTVCIPPSDEVFESAALANWLEASEITLLHCVPSSFRLLLGANLCSARLRELRTVVVGGGALLPPDVNRWNSVYGGTKELIGVYGQTETSLAKFFYRVPPTLVTAGYLPMGRPLPGAQAILLNANLEPCAPGETGELYVRTPYRSLGYYRQPELTQAAFVSNPYSKGEQDVLYKTGDLAMLLADGTFRYMGRRDFQVKVRGMRVETGEVESALGDLRDVAQAVVLAHDAGEGEKSLTGYVIAQPDHADAGLPARIRAQLLDALPDYMVPSHIMVLERFPLTPNGKIDRAAFPRPEAGQGAAPYVAPRTPAEARLCEIWTEILGLVRVGVHDDFFLLGGHSLLATQAVARVNAAFGIRMPVRSLFEAPTIAALALCIEQAARADGAAPVIRPRLQTATAPLSFAQRRLWFLDQLEPGSPLYNLPSALRLSGTLDAAALEQALNLLVVRHAVLRTRFASQDGEPVQLIVPDLALSLPLTDLSALPHGERVARADWHIQEEMRAPFDLAVGPPIRAQLLRLEPQAHVLLLTVHHIATDGWSNNLLARELADCYRAVISGETVKLPVLPIQYADYASWQHDHLQGDVLARQLDYWTAQLAGAPAMLELPTDRQRPQAQTHEGAMYRFTLPAARLRVVAGGERATLFMALTAVFSMLLARYSGQDDICIGTPVANRSQAETENLVGFFANTLVLRTRLDSDTDFNALLRQVRTTALDAFAHQELPFEKLVEALQPERSMDRSPLFQAMLVLQNTPGAAFALPGLEWQAIDSDSRTAKFDITLAVAGDGDVLEAGLEYNTALFDHDTIARMAGHLLRLIDAACADPALPLAELPMLGPEERQQILYGFNPGHSSPPGTIQAMFKVAAGRTPDAIAVEYEDQILSYAELDARTNRLARELLTMGVRTDARVGVCLERSPAVVIALLAVLKAGAAYVPLDPGYPRDRLSAMLEDAAPTLVLTQTSLIDRLPAISSVSMEALEKRAKQQAADSLNLHIPPDSLAYVLFTSGSTGRPKGVAMPSAALANLLAWQLEQRRSTQTMRVFQFASLNFDVSFQEIFSALCAGDTLVLCSEARRADLDGLRSYIAERRCGRVFLPNAVLQHFAGGPDMAPWPEPCDIVTAGEQLAITDALTKLVRTTGAAMVYNQYGPTETHVATQSGLEVKRIADWPALPPIGRPIAGMCCHILDRALNPVPVGVVGELYIAGAGLARGYIGRPGLTAGRFLPNPYGAPGTRMYRSGDLARYRDDGEIEFLGRADQQVKLRGFRIELGEVEAALSSCATGCEVVAVVREDQPGDRRLVAYVAGTNPPDADELRSALRSLLPDYMLPSHIVPLASLPLTPNGKVDRGALPLPEVRVGEGRYEAPEGPLEETLAGIWCAVLNAGQVGRHDNFFSLGGHSLLAMRLIARIREEFDVDLPPRTLFDGPTVAAQAEAVEALILQKIEGMTDEQARSIANDLSE
ncbi:amino acid adenylation domain-containing protein, partial [Duganella sacchari]